jgi:predicted NBD/HSP70 family sugar kinase
VSLSSLLDALAEPDESPSDHPSDLGARLGQVNRRAAGGERRVLDAIDEQAHWLGIGMSALANILNPDTFVLGGHFSVLREYYREPVLSELGSRLLAGSVSRVEFSDLEFEAASLGAAHAGIAQLIADPTLARIRSSQGTQGTQT